MKGGRAAKRREAISLNRRKIVEKDFE